MVDGAEALVHALGREMPLGDHGLERCGRRAARGALQIAQLRVQGEYFTLNSRDGLLCSGSDAL